MMNFSETVPLVITGLSMFISIVFHWRNQRRFLLPTLFSGAATAFIALCMIFLVQEDYLNFGIGEQTLNSLALAVLLVAGSGFVYGVLISAFIGYLLKVAPSFFD